VAVTSDVLKINKDGAFREAEKVWILASLVWP